MKQDKTKSSAVRVCKEYNFNLFMAVSCAVIFSLIAFVLNPIYVSVASNIVTSVTLLPAFMELLIDSLDIIAFVIAYGLIIYSATTRCSSVAVKLCGIYIIACLVRRIATLIMSAGSISGEDILSVVVYFLLEGIQAVVVTALAVSAAKSFHVKAAQMEKAARHLGDSSKYRDLEFTCVYSKHNPLQRSALRTGIILSAVKIASRIIYDLSYGAPQDAREILTMVIYYFSDVLICVIFYALCWLLLSTLYKKDRNISDNGL